MNTINNKEKKQINKVLISKFILLKGETNKMEIASSLGISMPTVLQNVKELIDENIVAEIGSYQSTGGRKAKAISIVGNARYSIGIDITLNHISFVLLDLKGDLIATCRIRMVYENTIDYYELLKNELNKFISFNKISNEIILGVGIALPGIIDKQKEVLIKSHILNLDNISLKSISQLLPYEVSYENDANSAALAELRFVNQNAVYLSLSDTVGGAVYLNNSIYMGDNFRSTEFGHVIIESNGKLCYCGKKGCMDAYCSAKILSDSTDSNLEEFFIQLENKNPKSMKVWNQYLEYLAIAVTNLRMTFDCDIILGGYMGRFLGKYMTQLNRKVLLYNKFESDTSYLKTCMNQKEASAIGVALRFINAFFESI